MDLLKAKLIGELIGIARATDGNEHLISDQSTAFILECLSSAPMNETQLHAYLSRAEEVKKSMVPDCFLCANPCGRTSAFDLWELEGLPEPVRNKKYRILELLLKVSERTARSALYRGLIALGMEGLELETLDIIANELNE